MGAAASLVDPESLEPVAEMVDNRKPGQAVDFTVQFAYGETFVLIFFNYFKLTTSRFY